MKGWEGALCLSCWPDDSAGGGEARQSAHVSGQCVTNSHQVVVVPGQAQGPRIRSTPPPVPTVKGAVGVRCYRFWSSTLIIVQLRKTIVDGL